MPGLFHITEHGVTVNAPVDPDTAAPERPLRPLPLSRRAHEFVAHEMLVLIFSGRFRAGDRLPPERALAAEFGVSRPTIRQAVAVLAAHGLVESRVGSGTFVVGTPEGAAPAAENLDVTEIMEARLVFEVGAVRLAARRARRSREDLDVIAAIVEALEHLEAQDVFPVETDVAFHKAVLRVARNPRLDELLAPFWPLSAAATAAAAQNWSSDDTARIAAQHRAVFEALRMGDAELAGFEMERHLRTELARLADSSPSGGPPTRFFA
jgi:GntR family transcriptional repressor for pyruvate dehydrogenase complex